MPGSEDQGNHKQTEPEKESTMTNSSAAGSPATLTPHPNPRYNGGKMLSFVEQKSSEVTINGQAVVATEKEYLTLLQDALVIYAKPVQPSISDPSKVYAFARVQVRPGQIIGVTGFGRMAEPISQLIPGQVYSLVGKYNRRDRTQFLEAFSFAEVGSKDPAPAETPDSLPF